MKTLTVIPAIYCWFFTWEVKATLQESPFITGMVKIIVFSTWNATPPITIKANLNLRSESFCHNFFLNYWIESLYRYFDGFMLDKPVPSPHTCIGCQVGSVLKVYYVFWGRRASLSKKSARARQGGYMQCTKSINGINSFSPPISTEQLWHSSSLSRWAVVVGKADIPQHRFVKFWWPCPSIHALKMLYFA